MTTSGRTISVAGLLGIEGLRLTRRGRVVITVLVLLALAGAGLAGQRAVAGSPGAGVEVRLHTVAPGDTLWRYARASAAADEDVRDVVDELRELNGMATAEIEAGQVVLLPQE